jgi:hypothetical protein
VTAAELLELSDLMDKQLALRLAAYRDGYEAGRAAACVALAEIEHRREAAAWWREWAATLRRIIGNDTDPSARVNQVMAEIAADRKFMRQARARLAARPWELSPLESCALRRIRLADPGDPL